MKRIMFNLGNNPTFELYIFLRGKSVSEFDMKPKIASVTL